jgi:hypothetical protein
VKKAYLFILLVFPLIANAQDATPELITDRPDQTESSVIVPRKFLQIETGFIMEVYNTDLATEKSFSYNTTLLRYGLFQNFELRLGIDYLGEKEDFNDGENTNSISGFSPLYAGFKIKIIEEDGWKPAMALVGGLILPCTAREDFMPENTGADFRIAFSHTLSERFSLGYNLGAEWDGDTAIPSYFYSVSLGVGIIDKLGAFVESYGLVPESGAAEHLLDAGFTYLVCPNFQLDVSAGLGLQNSIDNFISFGLTLRLPE